MKACANSFLTASVRSLRTFLLTRAFWNLAVFTLAALIFMLSITDGTYLPSPFVFRARILLVIGALLWLSTLLACMHAFRLPETSPSILASLAFFLFLGLELLLLCDVARIL